MKAQQTERSNRKQSGANSQLLPYGVHFREQLAAADVQRWQEMAESRTIYQFFRDELEREPEQAIVKAVSNSGRGFLLDLRKVDDATFKRSCLVPLFQKVSEMVVSPIYRIIEREFPTVANFLMETKRTAHQRVACMLQSAESSLMIDGLGVRLARSFPEEPVQPIHDALLVRESFAEKAIELIKEQFAAVGLHPQVKYEVLA